MEAEGVLVARKVTQLSLVDPANAANTPNAARFMEQVHAGCPITRLATKCSSGFDYCWPVYV